MSEDFGMRSTTPPGHCGEVEPHGGHEWLEGGALRRECPGNDPERSQDATDWLGWCSWPPRGGETPMPGAQFDDLLATDEPDPAPRLVGLMGRPRRFRRAKETR